MKYLLLVFMLVGCSQNRDKIFKRAERYCRCNGSIVESVSYFGSLNALVRCRNGLLADIGENDYVRECNDDHPAQKDNRPPRA